MLALSSKLVPEIKPTTKIELMRLFCSDTIVYMLELELVLLGRRVCTGSMWQHFFCICRVCIEMPKAKRSATLGAYVCQNRRHFRGHTNNSSYGKLRVPRDSREQPAY